MYMLFRYAVTNSYTTKPLPKEVKNICLVLCKDSAAKYKKLGSQGITFTARCINMLMIMNGSAILNYEN